MVNIQITLGKQNIVNDVSAECNLLGRTMEASGKSEDGASSLVELAGYIKSPDDDETKPVVARAMTEGWDQVKESCQRFVRFGRTCDDNRLESITIDVSEQINVNQNVFQQYAWEQNGTQWKRKLGTVSLKKGINYHVSWELSSISPTGCDNVFWLYVGKNLVWSGKFNGDTLSVSNVITPSESLASAEVYLITAQTALSLPTCTTGDSAIVINHKEFDNYVLELSMDDSFNTGVTSSIKSYAHRLIVDTVIAAVLKNQQVDGYTKYIATAKSAKEALIRVLQARSSFMRHTSSWM